MPKLMDAKQIAADKAVEFIQDGMVVGLGSGSTVDWATQRLAERVREGLRIQVIAASARSEALALFLNIPLTSFAQIQAIDLTIDGANEVDPHLNLIKGGGGSLLREKILSANSRTFIVAVDESKLVSHLGKFPLPVEVVPFGWEMTVKSLQKLGCTPVLRLKEGVAFLTDNGNYIVDCAFLPISQPDELYAQINLIPGVVENGLFLRMVGKLVVGYSDGKFSIR
jgi:ribose 5-phosphate isomerase A